MSDISEKIGVVQRQPETLNDLKNTQFKMMIRKLPNVTYFAQNVVLPGVQVGVVERNTPVGKLYHPGDYSFDEISINFLVDENLSNWISVYEWMKQITNIGNFTDYNRDEIYSDVSIVSLNNHSGYNKEFQLTNVFPVTLSGIEFDSTSDRSEPVIANVTFRYTLLKVICDCNT